jgi:hypothetical protein
MSRQTSRGEAPVAVVCEDFGDPVLATRRADRRAVGDFLQDTQNLLFGVRLAGHG